MILDVILRVAAKLFIPFILMFGLYVQMHGDYGPGGGFQAGVICAAAVILYAIVFGIEAAERAVPRRLAETMIPIGVMIYAGTGLWALAMGGSYLEYSVLIHNPPTLERQVHGQEWGVFMIEIGVLVTVSSTMLTIFYNFADRGRQE